MTLTLGDVEDCLPYGIVLRMVLSSVWWNATLFLFYLQCSWQLIILSIVICREE